MTAAFLLGFLAKKIWQPFSDLLHMFKWSIGAIYKSECNSSSITKARCVINNIKIRGIDLKLPFLGMGSRCIGLAIPAPISTMKQNG